MPHFNRELLVTTKVSRQHETDFDEQVDAIIDTINQIDKKHVICNATEVLDIYLNSNREDHSCGNQRKKLVSGNRPFEFLAFKN